MLPMRGYPFGPGGYGGLLLLACHFQTRANDATVQNDAASRASLLIMSGGELEEVRQTGSHRPRPSDPSFIPVGEQ